MNFDIDQLQAETAGGLWPEKWPAKVDCYETDGPSDIELLIENENKREKYT